MSRRGLAGRWAAAAVLSAVLAAPAVAAADVLPLPTPQREFPVLGGPALSSEVVLPPVTPGPVDNGQDVRVGVGADGTPAAVVLEQRLVVRGVGDYRIREPGPVLAVAPVGESAPPVLRRGTAVWQGFSPGQRELSARLTLDAELEAGRLPMAVAVDFAAADGRPAALLPGGRAPTAGSATVRLINQSTRPQPVAAGTADPGVVAPVLQTLLEAALRPSPAGPPTAGAGLPATIAAVPETPTTTSVPAAPTDVRVTAPLVVTGTIGAEPVDRLLVDEAASITVPLARGAVLGLDLTVLPGLDDQALRPPPGFATWPAWAAARPPPAAQSAATRTLLLQAAAAARSAEYVPYVSLDVPGPATASFHYTVAPAPVQAASVVPLSLHRGALAATVVALLALAVNAALLWRLC